MNKYYKQIATLILLVFAAVACAPTSAPEPTAAIPVQQASTVVPTALPSTPTALPATAINPPPTTVPPTDVVEADTDQDNPNVIEANSMNIQIGDTVLTATLAANSSVEALKAALSEGPITINLQDYGSMEKVGLLGMELPRNDQQITTEAGDIILYQGGALVIYYAPNSWSFTRLGKINNVTAEELREILGDGNVTVTLFLP